MNIFCYFVEPSSYTIDLAEHVYLKHKIPFAFIKSSSIARSTKDIKRHTFLQNLYLYRKLRFIFNICRHYDLIIINGYNHYVFFLTFFYNIIFYKKKYIAIESDTPLHIPSNLFKRFIKSVYLNFIFKKPYVLGFAGGTRTHKDLFRYYGMNEDRIFLMPMVVDNKRFFGEYNNKIPITFLYVGRIIKKKNVEVLVKSFLSRFSHEEAELHIVGDGDQLEKIKSKYMHAKIKYKGELFGKDLIQAFHEASIFILPSLIEPWGLVINEALSAGLPVISRKEVGANFDLLYNKDTGYIVENDKQMLASMLSLYQDSELRVRFSNNAIQLMKNYWNYDLYISCLNIVIQDIRNAIQ